MFMITRFKNHCPACFQCTVLNLTSERLSSYVHHGMALLWFISLISVILFPFMPVFGLSSVVYTVFLTNHSQYLLINTYMSIYCTTYSLLCFLSASLESHFWTPWVHFSLALQLLPKRAHCSSLNICHFRFFTGVTSVYFLGWLIQHTP
jgi:hypothetical protein